MAKSSKMAHTWGRSFSERVRGFGLPFEDRFRSIRKKKVKGKCCFCMVTFVSNFVRFYASITVCFSG